MKETSASVRGANSLEAEPRMIEERCVEHHSKTGSILAMTSEGIVFGRGVIQTKMLMEERGRLVEVENLKGTPWQPKEPRAVVARDTMLAGGEVKPLPLISKIRGAPLKRKVVRAERRCRDARILG